MGDATLISSICKEGNLTTIYGPPDAGKTSFAVLLMEYMVAQGYEVWTIIHFFEYEEIKAAIDMKRLSTFGGHQYRRLPPEIHTITSLSNLIKGLLNVKLVNIRNKEVYRHGKHVVIIDEGGIFGTSSTPNSKKVKTLKQLSYLIRHLNAAMFLIAQSKGSMVPDLRENMVTFELRIRKYTKNKRMISIATGLPVIDDYGNERVEFVINDEYYDIPPTIYPFDSKYFPKFTMDYDLDMVCDVLGEYNSVKLMKVDSSGKPLGLRLLEEMDDELRKVKKSKDNFKKNIVKRRSAKDIVLNHPESFEEAFVLCKKEGHKLTRQHYRQIKSDERGM